MKAITTKFHGPTNTKGSRYSATDSDGNRIVLGTDHALNSDGNHKRAALALCEKMGWDRHIYGGGTKDGMVFVFGPDWAGCSRASNRIADLVCAMYHPNDAKTRLTWPTATWAEIIASEIGVETNQ